MAVRTFLQRSKKVARPARREAPAVPRTLGEHILKKRVESGMLQRQVARLIAVSEDTVTYWENGRSAPQVQFYPAIIAFLEYYPFEDETSTVAGKLRRVMNCNGWSHGTCATALGMDGGTVKRILSGRRSTPEKTDTVLQRWAKLPDHLKQQRRSS